MGTPERYTLPHTQAQVAETQTDVLKILAKLEERAKAKEGKEKADKENAEANMKKLSEALLKIPLQLKASADHLKESGKELAVAADKAEIAILLALPVLPPPPQSAGSSSSAGPASS